MAWHTVHMLTGTHGSTDGDAQANNGIGMCYFDTSAASAGIGTYGAAHTAFSSCFLPLASMMTGGLI
jgi:hypothetical protein